MSSQPPLDERQIRKQQIRPRFLDLAEFDDDFPEDGSFLSSSRRAAPGGSFTNWPPAATVVRKKPPAIISSSKVEEPSTESQGGASRKATVQHAENSQPSPPKPVLTDPKPRQAAPQPQTQQQPKNVRFTSDTVTKDEAASTEQAPPKATLDFAGSIIGTIQERPVGERRTRPSGSSKPKPSGSRFVVRRRMDEDLQKHEEQREQKLQAEATQTTQVTPNGQEPGTGFPVVSHRSQIALILPPTSSKARTIQYSEDIDTVEAPQRDAIATQTALSGSSSTAQSGTAASADDEEWLTEDGKSMSAFRRSRLVRQGLRPPSVRTKNTQRSNSNAGDHDVPSFKPDPTRDPGGGADIDAITAVLSKVSRENDQKLRQMSVAEVSEEIRSLESLFGKDVLDALRNRKGAGNSKQTDQAARDTASTSAPTKTHAEPNIGSSQWDGQEDGPLAIKRQFFPAEPEGPNPTLEWMMPQQSSRQKASTELRFDFSGEIIQGGSQTDKTYLSGLHHHGDDQEAPGYTFSELIHLSRSTVAAQRQLALNVLGRICEQYPSFEQVDGKRPSPAVQALNKDALLSRARAISISRWLLGDRHFTVRSAALRCLASAVRSLPSGTALPLGATQELNFNHLFKAATSDVGGKDESNDASEVELSVQKDWATVMLDSNILSLFLDRTDSVITSTWEAELALELLMRIASCSVSHAQQLFETDTRRLCDFVVHLGLKVAWPPIPSDDTPPSTAASRSNSLPSLMAVRLLHQGVLSDREIAESIVLSGSIEHLLRFVVTPPWKVEEDWTSNDKEGDVIVLTAYQVFDEVLQLFTSLASYGYFASVVARTWNLWQECGTWAATQLVGVQSSEVVSATRTWIQESRGTAAQRIFEILAAWTHCAMDPHELMTAHDITWTQVRDWIGLVKDTSEQVGKTTSNLPVSITAPAFGALCWYIDAWLRCAIGKEPKLLQKYIEACKSVMSHCQGPVQQYFLQVLRLFSTALSQDIALDEAEQACRACHRYLDLVKMIKRAEQVSQGRQQVKSGRGDVMLQQGMALVACGPLWQALKSVESQASGRSAYIETFSNFVAAVVAVGSKAESERSVELAAITRLDARHADRVANIVLRVSESLAGKSTVHALRPFLLECMLGSNRVPPASQSSAVEHRDSTPLSRVKSLFRSASPVSTNEAAKKSIDKEKGEEDETEEDDEDIDPITGSKLWKCPASGLPIRADWPLLPLDDLLHSGNTAVFNRPDNLEEDWKPSELEMVRSSLRLAVVVFRSLLQEHASETTHSAEKNALEVKSSATMCSLPSAEQVLLGVVKVFMLEKDQPDTFTDKTTAGALQQKQTGVLTGRDLFRDPTISSDLASLLDIADELVELRQGYSSQSSISAITLDTWTAATYGGGMSFYQFFTDLVGLWDSVSFGDANFARVVMTVANAGCGGGLFEGEHGIAVDFRRLVWNDYSDSLRSIPPTKAPKWLLSWSDTGVDMLEHYCRYIVSAAEMPKARESIAWQIASHHVSAAARSLSTDKAAADKQKKEAPTKRVESILRSLVTAKDEGLLREVLAALASTTNDSQAEDLDLVFTRLNLLQAQQ